MQNNDTEKLNTDFAALPMRVALATFAPPTDDRLRFIKQIGADDVIVWGNTFRAPALDSQNRQPVAPDELTFKELVTLRSRIEDYGLRFFAIENVPVHFYDKIMLGKDGRERQIEHYQNTIRAVGRAGIPILGYNWMPSGVWRTSFTKRLRGGARGTAFDSRLAEGAPPTHGREYSEAEFWENLHYFLENVIPVAEAENVKLAIHPNDPPIERVGGLPCLFRSFETISRALDLVPSDNHGLTFCLGTWGEMGVNLVETIRHFGARKKLFYVHFQATNGHVPEFNETFVDAADYVAFEIIRALKAANFNGVMIPGHVPQIEGDTEWRTPESAAFTPYNHPMGGHRARAYTIGFLRGMLHVLDCESDNKTNDK